MKFSYIFLTFYLSGEVDNGGSAGPRQAGEW